MTLRSLRDLRVKGARPEGVFLLVIGDKPAWVQDSPLKEFIPTHTNPADLDLRPLIGMSFAIVVAKRADTLLDTLLNMLEAAKAIPYGIAMHDGKTLMAAHEPEPAAEANLYEVWRQYVQ